MSESILEAIVKHVVGGLSSQIRMLRDFDDAIEKLRNTIYTTQAQLLDAEDKHATTGDVALNHWVEKLKDAFNDAEDLLDLVSSTDLMTKMDKEVIEERDHEPSRGNLVGGSGRQPAPSSAVPFSSLKELTLYKLPNLTGWRMRREGVAAKNQQFPLFPLFLSFPCLSKLSIEHCPNLTSMPLFLNLEEDLKLTDVRRELLQQQSMMSMHIASIKDLDGIQWQSLRNLRSLVLITISNLVYLPDEIQYATTLQHLKIVNCSNLMTLPEWMGNLMSLQKLEISQCPNLTSLPDEIYHLQKLIISDCPKLLERSHTETAWDMERLKAGSCSNLLALQCSNNLVTNRL
nr:disease resistance protein tao1 [Quercus suber]